LRFEFLAGRITVSLGPPADPPKEGGRFDLPSALGGPAAPPEDDASAPPLLALAA